MKNFGRVYVLWRVKKGNRASTQEEMSILI